MKNRYSSHLSILFILVFLGFLFFSMMPFEHSVAPVSLSDFSTQRALEQVKNIAKKPHYVGSQNHNVVANYLVKELSRMGLDVSIQEGFAFSDWGTLTKCKNILARIKGTNSHKALLLLSHYDSAPHSSSMGASDAGTGVATILEGVRAFLHQNKPHKNDVLILFSDAEELGLNGAALFVTQHKWTKEVGVVLNFEARGSAGPSYMLMETNGGNDQLVQEFTKANMTFPVSNSFMYSLYKLLPNDTDLTVFREQANIQGYNFAFIDGHYNYHTAQDDLNHLDINSLKHQGNYLMPLLTHFANANLNLAPTFQDSVYFSIPGAFISYPFDWVVTMQVVAVVLWLLFLFIGIGKRVLTLSEMLKGFLPFLCSLLLGGLISFFGWKLLLVLYPQYNDFLNGFTYNGHHYIAAFTLLSLSICFAFYQIFSSKKATMNHYIAPLFFWILINGFLAKYLKGAGFLILPVFSGLLLLGFYVLTQKSNWILNLVLGIPTLLLIVPFIPLFPIGLGLKVLVGSAVLSVLSFGLLLPVFGSFIRKGKLSLFLLLLACGFFVKAHYKAGYEVGKAKSNSLVYMLDADSNKASWVTYDTNLDEWTKKYVGNHPQDAKKLNEFPLTNKYNSGFRYAAAAPMKNISRPFVEYLKDSVVAGNRFLKIRITPTRKVNRYDIFANENVVVQNFTANGMTILGQKGHTYQRKGKKLVTYYVVDQLPLEIECKVAASAILDVTLFESSFDLMNNPLFQMTKRAPWMMPKPFVLTDAVVVKETIKPLSMTFKPANRTILNSITSN